MVDTRVVRDLPKDVLFGPAFKPVVATGHYITAVELFHAGEYGRLWGSLNL